MKMIVSAKKKAKSLQFLALKEVVKLLFKSAEHNEDSFLQEVLHILQNLGYFSDVFLHSMRHLQQQYERSKPRTSENLDGVVKILLPTLLNSRLTILNLKCEFVEFSYQAREIILSSIRHLNYLEKVDVTGFCTDELSIQLSQHARNLRHLVANNSKHLTDLSLSALSGVLRINSNFVIGCKMLKRLEIQNCPLISASKIVSLLLTLPNITYLASEKLSQVFQSSALFESDLQFQLTNFEHVVTHLERAREKINHHLKSDDHFLEKVNEIFPRIATVKLTLSHLYDDTRTLKQLIPFASIHTLVLEQPVGRLDENFREFLMEKGHQLKKLCLKAHAASLADLASVFHFCLGLKILQFYSVTLESSLENFSLHSIGDCPSLKSQGSLFWMLQDLSEIYLGSGKIVPTSSVIQRLEGQTLFQDFFSDMMVRSPKLKSLVLSGQCCTWLNDENLDKILSSGRLGQIKRLSVTGKSPLSMSSGKKLLCQCPELQKMMVSGWSVGNNSSSANN